MNAHEQLSRQALDKFKAIYKAEFGEEITYEVAQERALRLLRFLKLLLE